MNSLSMCGCTFLAYFFVVGLSEVDDFGDEEAVVSADEDVDGFEVEVHDLVAD